MAPKSCSPYGSSSSFLKSSNVRTAFMSARRWRLSSEATPGVRITRPPKNVLRNVSLSVAILLSAIVVSFQQVEFDLIYSVRQIAASGHSQIGSECSRHDDGHRTGRFLLSLDQAAQQGSSLIRCQLGEKVFSVGGHLRFLSLHKSYRAPWPRCQAMASAMVSSSLMISRSLFIRVSCWRWATPKAPGSWT